MSIQRVTEKTESISLLSLREFVPVPTFRVLFFIKIICIRQYFFKMLSYLSFEILNLTGLFESGHLTFKSMGVRIIRPKIDRLQSRGYVISSY